MAAAAFDRCAEGVAREGAFAVSGSEIEAGGEAGVLRDRSLERLES
jgi:hypothetical protein